MPSRGFYEVANVEEGKVVHRDQSYRSCILTLIIFLFLCIVLIVVGLLLRKSHSYNKDEDLRSVEGLRNPYKDRAKGTTSTTESLQYSTHSTVSNETNEIKPKTSTTTIAVTNWTDTSHIFERLENAATTAETETSIFSVATTELIISEETSISSTTNTELVTDKAEKPSTITSPSTTPTTESVTKDGETLTPTTTEFVADKEETLTSPITTESVINVEETSTSATTKFIIDVEEETSPITTESVTKDEETSTSSTTEFVTDKEETLTSPVTTESVINAGETSTSATTEFATDEEEKTSPITTESVTKHEEISTSPTNEFVTDEEEKTSPITTESVIKHEEISTSPTNEFVTDEEEKTSPITTESVIKHEETSAYTTTEFVTDEEEKNSPITTESVIKHEETSAYTTTEFVTDEEEKTSPITTESVTEDEETSTSPTTELVTDKEEETSPITTESVTEDEETSTSSTITTELATNKDEESTVETSTIFTENVTEISTVTTEKSEDVTELESSTTSDSEFSTETILSSTAADAITASTTGSEEETTVSDTTDSLQSATTHSALSTVESRLSTNTFGYENETEVCTTGECKNLASKMVFYMNHTVDPCDDFYEYACGGFEANPRIGEVGFESAAYNRILRQLRQEIREGKSSLFTTYYDSCMHYETLILEEKISAAKEALNSVGKFYTNDNLDYANFTDLVARLLLHNSALLFDVSPELDESNPSLFTLRIGPTTQKSPFEVDGTEDDPCYASQFERDQETVDLKKLYKEYKSCKKNKNELLNSIGEALSTFGVFNELKNKYNISQHVDTTVINIDMEIVQKFFANFPSKDQIREAYLMKEYRNVSITELQTNCKIINWPQLIKYLTKYNIEPEVYVQVYFYDALIKGLKNLEEFGSKSPIELNNALLGLYAQTLYQQLILPKHVDPKDYCLRVATNLLTPEASNLYISTFSKDELVYMNDTIHRLFEELKETLKLKVEESEWTKEDRERLVAKVDSLKVVTPDISYFGHNESVYGSMKADKLTDNYFNNSITLMKRYRERMYTQFRYNPGDPEQIWTYYTTPFQSKGLVVYELNLVVIPFGAIDWSVQYDKPSFDYITLARIGTTIAHQIAHHFDAIGISYQSGSRHNTRLLDGSIANLTFQRYISCQQTYYDGYDKPLTMTLPSTGQTVSYGISELTLNERLSETVGVRLAYDTLDRLRSSEEVHLPWLDLDSNQLFYLTYAQMHCTKLPLTSSYVSLYEDEQLPSRIRIFVSALNNRLLGEAWKCPDGSGIFRSNSCDVLPYLHIEEIPESPHIIS
ncbi:neprilysin isoform X2 [Halictus rubicundus]|uniref:neprilysin isoform X2 n=1 Tax=Halictus rubicundus TaxID=77578 RepID=UPI0040375465